MRASQENQDSWILSGWCGMNPSKYYSAQSQCTHTLVVGFSVGMEFNGICVCLFSFCQQITKNSMWISAVLAFSFLKESLYEDVWWPWSMVKRDTILVQYASYHGMSSPISQKLILFTQLNIQLKSTRLVWTWQLLNVKPFSNQRACTMLRYGL